MWRCRRPETLKALLAAASLLAGGVVEARVIEQVNLTLDSGRVLRAEIRTPVAASASASESAPLPAVMPAVMLFGGFRGAATVLDTVPPDLPIVAASFDYPFDPPRKFVFPDSFAHIPAMARGIDETFEGIRQLSAYLRARDDIDASRLSIVGASLGAPFATISAAELKLPGLVIVHGFGEVRQVLAHQLQRALERRWGAWTRWPAQGLANVLAWGFRLPQPERHARVLRDGQRALMIVAGDDELIPERATESLWTALQASGAKVERVDETGGHLRGIGDPRIGELVGTALDWMQRNDLR